MSGGCASVQVIALSVAHTVALLLICPQEGQVNLDGAVAAAALRPDAVDDEEDSNYWGYRALLAFVAVLWGTNFGTVKFVQNADISASVAACKSDQKRTRTSGEAAFSTTLSV
jgi:hypothetical protein